MQSALNGYFERVRRLFQLVGTSDVPAGITPIVIAGDTREPGNPNVAYRRAGLGTLITAGPVAVDTPYKIRFDLDFVVDQLMLTWATAATSGIEARCMSVADVIADAAATWTTPTSAQAGWMDRPDAGPPPFRVAGNGSNGVGRVVWMFPRPGNGEWYLPAPLFFPAGSALYLRANNNAITNWQVALSGYQKSEKGA